jgi:galactokinase
VLAAAVDMDMLCIAAANDENVIRIHSEGYPQMTVDISSLEPRREEANTSPALIRGVARAASDRGYKLSGFDAYTVSEVLKGSGLSSSAAFEAALGVMISGMCNEGKIPPVELAQMGQYAENTYFGKPSGLMDQMACSVGGLILIDFEDPEKPLLHEIGFDFSQSGYSLCIVDTRGDHADLTDDYSAIPGEMRRVAEFFGKRYLRQLDEGEFYSNISGLREKCGDRAVARAIHYYNDNARVPMQAEALRRGDFSGFLRLVTESGYSSGLYLQNLYSCKTYERQGLTVALAVSEKLLKDRGGAWRVQGGGFAGTIEAFVPNALVGDYSEAMEGIFGKGCCHRMIIRPLGAIEIKPG